MNRRARFHRLETPRVFRGRACRKRLVLHALLAVRTVSIVRAPELRHASKVLSNAVTTPGTSRWLDGGVRISRPRTCEQAHIALGAATRANAMGEERQPRHNKALETDAQGRPRGWSRASVLGRRSALR
jgi:hypothetical protein